MLRSAITGRRRVVALFGSVGLMVVLAVAVSGPQMAVGQATRTWVSGVGDDANPCARTAPCKTFAGAIPKTAAGGEINCLDPGGFGAVTITKSITINCIGTFGSILAAGVNGVIVNAAATDIVVLRGLNINGAPPTTPGLNGIRFLAGAALYVSDSLIQGFRSTAAGNGHGIAFVPSGAAELHVSNTQITNNGGSANGAGILIQPTGAGGTAKVSLDNVSLANNFQGLRADSTGATAPNPIKVSITGSSATGNTGHGFAAISNTGAVEMMIDSSMSSYNGLSGIVCSGAACMTRVGRSTITGNATGTNQLSSGVIQSYQTNQIHSNTNDGTRVDIALE